MPTLFQSMQRFEGQAKEIVKLKKFVKPELLM